MPDSDHPRRRASDQEETHSPLTPDEIQSIADRQKTRNSLALFSAIIQVVATVAFVIIALILLSASSNQTAFSNRSDCKTTYQSILAAPVTERDNLQADVSALSGDLESQLGAALLDGQQGVQVTPAQVTQFADTKQALDAKRTQLEHSIVVVQRLPSLATASEHGFRLNGVRYPACPKG